MSFEIDTAFVQQYRGNVMMLVQQKGSRLRPYVMNDTVTGESAFFEQIGSVQAQQVTNRHGDSPLISTPHARRKVSLADYEWGDLVDNLDKVRMLIDPTSPYAINAGWAMGRAIDDVIINAAFADAATGKDGTTTVSFPSSQQVAHNFVETGSAAASDLTIGKLREAKRIFDANEVDADEPRWIAHTAKQINSLLQTTEVTNADYNSVRALVQGQVNSFLGFNFVHTERLAVDGSGYRRLIAGVASGIGLGMGKEPVSRITERADKRFSVYVYYCMSLGATRIEEEKVVEIKCDES